MKLKPSKELAFIIESTVIIWIMSRDIIFWKFPKVGHYSRVKFLTFNLRQFNHLQQNLILN